MKKQLKFLSIILLSFTLLSQSFSADTAPPPSRTVAVWRGFTKTVSTFFGPRVCKTTGDVVGFGLVLGFIAVSWILSPFININK